MLSPKATHCQLAAPPSVVVAGLQSEESRVQDLRKFIEYAAGLPDVWFVTTQQVGPAGTAAWLARATSCRPQAAAYHASAGALSTLLPLL